MSAGAYLQVFSCLKKRSKISLPNGWIIGWVHLAVFQTPLRQDLKLNKRCFESEWISLQPLSKHHFNLKHLLGVVNWHLPRRGTHKHSFIHLSPLTFPLFICLPQSPPFLAPLPRLLSFLAPLRAFLHGALFPFCHFPPLCFSPENYTTYSQ